MSQNWILTAGEVTAEAYIICQSRPEHEFATDTLDLIGVRFSRRVARQTLLARPQKLLRPAVIQILVNTFFATQLGDARFVSFPVKWTTLK